MPPIEPEFAHSDLSRSRDWYDDKDRRSQGNQLTIMIGVALIFAVLMAYVALATWSVQDPSFSNANGNFPKNWLGFWGASFADFSIQMFGIGAAVLLVPPAMIGWTMILRNPIGRWKSRLIAMIMGLVMTSWALCWLPTPQSWPLPTTLGGIVGQIPLNIAHLFSDNTPGFWVSSLLFFVFAALATWAILHASALINTMNAHQASEEQDSSSYILGLMAHWYYSYRVRADRKKTKKLDQAHSQNPNASNINGAANSRSIFNKLTGWFSRVRQNDDTFHLDRTKGPLEDFESTNDHHPTYGERIYESEIPQIDLADEFAAPYEVETQDWDGLHAEDPGFVPDTDKEIGGNAATSTRIEPTNRIDVPADKPRPGKRVVREAQASLFDSHEFSLPPLHFLGEPKNVVRDSTMTDDALEQNARLLEGVLQDFGVKGEIINVRPGPVVTLYELEPAPGIKSSRVIGLADDIARSMSAIAARVAVVPGRNAIGIELPNQKRETVFLKELLASADFENSKAKLPLSLGKSIGGESVIADLTKMPHLLVAGTTGSGKSVAINTMILSVLYRLPPQKVKMIMIDPKMLELSIYDGIPHLLTPVVTDPKKAVVALKWTVREMEERYKNMSKLGVRNIDGYNARLEKAKKNNEQLTKTVQTGFDPDTGEAIYETEELSLEPMPYIVVIIDEMADLMMVAGKDIEGTVQRLAQMARAAGIHVIMATQRPSVDVITGTIKANFPTRISFQVTSKIDSRTILGEQGAEQLLGMGDMLYMAGGGRIKRVHGPFVGDSEVEHIVNHLKNQGVPQYLEAITEEDPEDEAVGAASGSSELAQSTDQYDQAVAIVLRDRKVSTSYIQRRLSIGYNRAATMVERMEQEGLISAANHAGKREILVPAENETV